MKTKRTGTPRGGPAALRTGLSAALGRGPLAKLLFALAIAAPVGAGLFRVWVSQDAVQIGYELSREVGRRTKLHALGRELEVELAAERAPDRLKRLASRLGLGPPGTERIFGAGQRQTKSRKNDPGDRRGP